MKKKSTTNAFTLAEAILALMISGVISVLACGFLNVLLKCSQLYTDHQNQFGILQLRETLAAAQEILVSSSQITFITRYEEFTIEFDRNRLVKRPGYEILLTEIEMGEFYEEGEKIYMVLEHRKIQLR